jgi:hypothetical protein
MHKKEGGKQLKDKQKTRKNNRQNKEIRTSASKKKGKNHQAKQGHN